LDPDLQKRKVNYGLLTERSGPSIGHDIPPFQISNPVKWVYKQKTGETGQIIRYKTRLVVIGFMQGNGIDVDETFAPVSKYTSLRFLIAHCCAENIDITHLDIKTAFLNVPLEEMCGVTPPRCISPTWPQVAI
jgi:hypothetical protein